MGSGVLSIENIGKCTPYSEYRKLVALLEQDHNVRITQIKQHSNTWKILLTAQTLTGVTCIIVFGKWSLVADLVKWPGAHLEQLSSWRYT